MVKLKYDKGGCLGCPKEMGCLGSGCPYCWEPVLVCDKCGQKVDGFYRDEDGWDWCEDCRDKLYTLIDDSNAGDYAKEDWE